MTVGQILAVLALVTTGMMLWVARQARIVREEVQAKRVAMETSDRAEGQQHLRGSHRPVRRNLRRTC